MYGFIIGFKGLFKMFHTTWGCLGSTLRVSRNFLTKKKTPTKPLCRNGGLMGGYGSFGYKLWLLFGWESMMGRR